MKPLMNLFIALPVVIVLTASCKPESLETMVGTLERDRVEIKVESNEPITAIHVTDGQHVAA